ncbi:MAG: DUF1326 domain-containing protein [Candidatus Dormibacteria bacterium]
MTAPPAASTSVATKWELKGIGYEFCNCNPGCTCNFNGFPTSKDGSCKAFVGNHIKSGRCGDVDLSNISVAAILDWPKAIHEGGGRAVFVVPPAVSDEQLNCLAQIFTGQLGGMPWEILGTTFEVAGVVRRDVTLEEAGRHSSIRIDGVGHAQSTTLKNPVTGDDNNVDIVLAEGFIWRVGEAGQGDFEVSAEGVSLKFTGTSSIHYDFDWSN